MHQKATKRGDIYRPGLVLYCGLSLLLLGTMGGIIGWFPGLEVLGRFRAEYIPMAPITGFLFIVLGGGLCAYCWIPRSRIQTLVVGAAGLLTALMASIILLQMLFQLDSDVEHFFTSSSGHFGQVRLARMSPLSAINFLLDGLALFFVMSPTSSRWRDKAAILSCFSAAITLTVALGYAYGTPIFYSASLIPMALSTALAFFYLDWVIILLAGPNRLPLRLFVGDSTRARLLRCFLPLALVAITVNGFLFHMALRFELEINQAVFHSVSALLTTLLTAMIVLGISRTISAKIEGVEAAKHAGEVQAALEREQIYRELQRSYKHSALGMMAGNIAHEINNPLTIIDGRAKQLGLILQTENFDRDMACRAARSISETTMRLGKIVRGLNTFSRNSEQDAFTSKSVRELIEETSAFCAPKLEYHDVSLSTAPMCPSLTIDCRPSEISQVLVNLINNAADAVEQLEEKWIKIAVVEEGEQVVVSVMDSGRGIAPEIRDKIQEPFFTTKSLGKGTGLGLSISKGLVASHGGTLTLDTHADHTCFKLRIPKQQASPLEEARAS